MIYGGEQSKTDKNLDDENRETIKTEVDRSLSKNHQ